MTVLEQEKPTGIVPGETDVEFEQTSVVDSAPIPATTPSTETEAPVTAEVVDNQPGETTAGGDKPKKQKKTRAKAKKGEGEEAAPVQPKPKRSYNQARVARALAGRAEAGEEAENATIDFEAEQADFSTLMGDSADKVIRRHDLGQLLDLMKKGVIVKLTVESPSFLARLDNDYLGLEHDELAQEVAKEYLDLGKLVLIPKDLYKQLQAAVSKARKTLYRFSVSSHWGQFVPVHNYARWKAANADCFEQFEEVRAEILERYPTLPGQILETYRPLAESTWKQYLMRRATQLRDQYAPAQVPQEQVTQLLNQRDSFIQIYLERIRKALPTREALESQFDYQVRLERIPLPTELARDKAQAEDIYREQVVKTTEHYEKLRTIQQREEMERDLIRSTQREAEELANKFFNDIVRSVNSSMVEVANDVLTSMEKHEGKLIGRSSTQLHNLLTELEGYREFLTDEKLAEQIGRIRQAFNQITPRSGASSSVTPVEKLRLDTQPLQRVLKQVRREAQTILLDLDTAPVSRTDLLRRAQSQAEGNDNLLDLDTPPTVPSAGNADAPGQGQGQSSRNQFSRRQRVQAAGDSPLLDI